MIVVKVHLTEGRSHIEVTGHSGYAEPGKDIVCAAVSAIMTTAALGLRALAEEYPDNVQVNIDASD